MNDLPSHSFTEEDLKLLQDAAELIKKGNSLRDNPSQLRLVLVEIQYHRFNIGKRWAVFKGLVRDEFRKAYNSNRQGRSMSSNAAYKEADTDEMVTKLKNSRDLMETAYEVLQNFVNTNQTSLGIAKEESKNNL